jgi:hypothetical protein
MSRQSPQISSAFAVGLALLAVWAPHVGLEGRATAQDVVLTKDPVVARLHEHVGDTVRPLVLVVDSSRFSPAVWKRVKDLIAFRLHRPQADGTTRTDAAIYLVHNSPLYLKAAAVLRSRTTNQDYVWCLLAAVIAHEAAHTAPLTEREALTAEAAQLRRCLFRGHLFSGDGWNPVEYLGQVEAKLRSPREHY